MSKDSIYANHKIPNAGSSGDLLKPDEGKPYEFRIIGEAVVYSSDYQGKESTSYAMAVWNFTDNQPNIWRLPAGAFRDIVELANSKWGEPTTYNVLYKKTGSALETRHSVQVSPSKDKPTAEQVAQVEAINLKEVLERFPSVNFVMTLSEAEGGMPERQMDESFSDEDMPEFDT